MFSVRAKHFVFCLYEMGRKTLLVKWKVIGQLKKLEVNSAWLHIESNVYVALYFKPLSNFWCYWDSCRTFFLVYIHQSVRRVCFGNWMNTLLLRSVVGFFILAIIAKDMKVSSSLSRLFKRSETLVTMFQKVINSKRQKLRGRSSLWAW